MKKSILFSLLMTFAPTAFAEDVTRCYALNIPHPDVQESTDEVIQEDVQNWCYRQLSSGGTYIYNADSEEVRQELAMTIDQSGMIKYGSLSQGEVTVQHVHQSELNPLNVPLQEPIHLAFVAHGPTALQASTADHVLAIFLRSPSLGAKSSFLEAGEFTATTEKLPWHGFSWSFNDHELFEGEDAPLAKYDRFVLAHAGESPGTVAWESEHHAGGAGWGGHCNGWASSAILRKEPREVLTDAKSGTIFAVSDLKGLLAVKDYCAKVAVYGNRNRESKTDRTDMDPVLFHKVVRYFIGEVRKPIAIEFRPDKVVDTHVASGYKMTIVDRGGGVYRVTAAMTMHKYLKGISEIVGAAPTYTRTYRYELTTNARGEITAGKWRSTNPDFIYNALSPGDCPDYHPGVSENYISQILGLSRQ